MKTATLAALISTALFLLYQTFYFLSINFFGSFYERLSYRGTRTIGSALLLLFVASLSYFFLVLYKNQKS